MDPDVKAYRIDLSINIKLDIDTEVETELLSDAIAEPSYASLNGASATVLATSFEEATRKAEILVEDFKEKVPEATQEQRGWTRVDFNQGNIVEVTDRVNPDDIVEKGELEFEDFGKEEQEYVI